MTDLTEEEFTKRFTAHALKQCGFTHFDDGTSVSDYCAEVGPSYWKDKNYSSEGPETCAEADMDYWGEE